MNNQEIVALGQKYIMNTYGRLPMSLVKGEGAYVWDADGKKYIDFVSGLAVNSLGHCHPKVVEAIREQAGTLMHTSNLYWIEPQAKLAQLLVENSAMDKTFFCNSGAEANEGAIKLARKYAKLHMGEGKYGIVTMSNSFHGRTLATLTATGQTKYQKGFDPLPPGFKYAPYNDLDALKEAIDDTTCAIMLEPIQGEGGVNVAEKEYLQAVRELCGQKGLLLIFDEVQCGLGRTGKLFAYEHHGVEPDIMTLAKALGGGFPIGALLAKEEVAGAFQPGDHASTFGGNPLASAAGVAFMETLLGEGILENTVTVGNYFKTKLQNLQQKYPVIKEVRGVGLMLGAELAAEGKPVVDYGLEKGVLINCANLFVLRFLPPLTITTDMVDEVLAVVEEGLGGL